MLPPGGGGGSSYAARRELSDAAVRPDQRHTSIATSSAALWTHEGGVAHRHSCVLGFSGLWGSVAGNLFQRLALQNLGEYDIMYAWVGPVLVFFNGVHLSWQKG